MIASSLPEGDELVDLLLNKEADVNAKSRHFPSMYYASMADGWMGLDYSGQVSCNMP